MHLSITGHHVEVTSAIKQYIENKMQYLNGHYERTMETHVVLTLDKGHQPRHSAEVSVHVQGKVLHASATTTDMYVAIDEMVGKIERQLEKYKTKSGH